LRSAHLLARLVVKPPELAAPLASMFEALARSLRQGAPPS
jgi:hypothetical protein